MVETSRAAHYQLEKKESDWGPPVPCGFVLAPAIVL